MRKANAFLTPLRINSWIETMKANLIYSKAIVGYFYLLNLLHLLVTGSPPYKSMSRSPDCSAVLYISTV